MEGIERVLLDERQLRERVRELGQDISRDYADGDLLLLGILKGSVIFLADLARAMTIPVDMDFIAVSSYGTSTATSGQVRLLKDLDAPIEGRDVLIVEDIIDSGLTLSYLMDMLGSRNPRSIKVAVLLDKPERRQEDVFPEYTGFTIPDEFVVGYGLDYAEQYRALPYIGVLSPAVYAEQ